MYKIQKRNRYEVNTDPQRRCYNGCHASSELVWGRWVDLVLSVPDEQVQEKLEWWRSLNDYAVSQRGEEARCEFRAVPVD